MGMKRIVLLFASMAVTVVFGSGVTLADSPTTKEDCKNGGYAKYGFKNQGQCMKAVNHATPADTTVQKLVFTSYREPYDGQGLRIFAMDLDGSNKQELPISVPGTLQAPTLSPDGTKIAFGVVASSLWVANADGSNAHPVVENVGTRQPTLATWSPDGSEIAFSMYKSESNGESDIYIADASQTNVYRPLTLDLPGGESTPSWSSTGKIAFSNYIDADNSRALYTINPDGSNLQQIALELAPIGE
jgi:Tol biopolymer transport system component